jgi:ribosomal protein S18 acetylase RimI-like enzyme
MAHTILVELAARLDDPNVISLLAFSVGSPTPEQLRTVTARYREQAQWRLLGIEQSGILAGCIGLELTMGTCAVIHNIAVAIEFRGRGFGRAMIEAVAKQFQLGELVAETDVDAVEFYRRCGFEITSLGERYPGVERFRCVKNFTTSVSEE